MAENIEIESMLKYGGIIGMAIGAAGFLYCFSNYCSYANERDRIITLNSKAMKNVREYNSNIVKINDLANRANNQVFGGIACLVIGAASGAAFNHGRSMQRNRLKKEKLSRRISTPIPPPVQKGYHNRGQH